MKYLARNKFYRINNSGHQKPTVIGWLTLIAWAYFLSRLLISFFYLQEVSNYEVTIIKVVGSLILLLGSWLIVTIINYTITSRKQFRRFATSFWINAIESKAIPAPPVKRVTYNYTQWKTAVIYPDNSIYSTTFTISVEQDRIHFAIPLHISRIITD